MIDSQKETLPLDVKYSEEGCHFRECESYFADIYRRLIFLENRVVLLNTQKEKHFL
jgi:hypothetical protein